MYNKYIYKRYDPILLDKCTLIWIKVNLEFYPMNGILNSGYRGQYQTTYANPK